MQAAPKCEDSDGRNNYDKSGYIKRNGRKYRDDYCKGNTAYDYYCTKYWPNFKVSKKQCPSGTKCNKGACIKTCTDECSSGQKDCDGNKAWTCVKGSDGCFDKKYATCESNQKCDNGVCVTGDCAPGEKQNCEKQQGVCKGAQETCTDELTWPGCDDNVYLDHNSLYKSDDSTCDSSDNDCDGEVDEDCVEPVAKTLETKSVETLDSGVEEEVVEQESQTGCDFGEWQPSDPTGIFYVEPDDVSVLLGSGSSEQVKLSIVDEDYVYKKYLMISEHDEEWSIMDFSQETAGSSNWIRGDVEELLNIDPDETKTGVIYLLAYTCKKKDKSRDWVPDEDCNLDNWIGQCFKVEVEEELEPDNDKASCEKCGFDWIVDSEYCCGDDKNEFTITEETGMDCCRHPLDILTSEGKCYNSPIPPCPKGAGYQACLEERAGWNKWPIDLDEVCQDVSITSEGEAEGEEEEVVEEDEEEVIECTDECSEEQTQCDDEFSGYYGCVDANEDGCLEFGGEWTGCGENEKCQDGGCVVSCVPKTCTELGKECGSHSDGCGGTLSCGTCVGGKECSGGQCVATCTDECTEAQTKCDSVNKYDVLICKKGSNGCTSWKKQETCTDAKCYTPKGIAKCCKNDCAKYNPKSCSADGKTVLRCIYSDSDPCLDKRNIACGAGKKCKNNACVQTQLSSEQLDVHYKFDGNGKDSIGKQHCPDTGPFVAGKFGKAKQFPPAVQPQTGAQKGLISAGLGSITMWIKKESDGVIYAETIRMIRKFNNFDLRTDRLILKPHNAHQISTVISTKAPPNNKWYFLAVTWNHKQRRMSIYINGVETKGVFAAASASGRHIYPVIGSKTRSAPAFVGALDDFRVYGRELTAKEIKQHYNANK